MPLPSVNLTIYFAELNRIKPSQRIKRSLKALRKFQLTDSNYDKSVIDVIIAAIVYSAVKNDGFPLRHCAYAQKRARITQKRMRMRKSSAHAQNPLRMRTSANMCRG